MPGADTWLTSLYLFTVVTLMLLCSVGWVSWFIIPFASMGTAGSFLALGGSSGPKWLMRVPLILIGERPGVTISRFINRPRGRSSHVIHLRGDPLLLDEGDLITILSVRRDGRRRALWVRHRASGDLWFSHAVGWGAAFGWIGFSAFVCVR